MNNHNNELPTAEQICKAAIEAQESFDTSIGYVTTSLKEIEERAIRWLGENKGYTAVILNLKKKIRPEDVKILEASLKSKGFELRYREPKFLSPDHLSEGYIQIGLKKCPVDQSGIPSITID